MILVGVNHHFRTNVFGVALLADETTSTFIWVLEQFLDCMERKHPKVIVTDGDNAMRSAISQVFPSSLHRLCAWHLDTNAASNVPDGEFKIKFTKLMYKSIQRMNLRPNGKKLSLNTICWTTPGRLSHKQKNLKKKIKKELG